MQIILETCLDLSSLTIDIKDCNNIFTLISMLIYLSKHFCARIN